MAMQKVREKNAAAHKGKTALGNRAILMSETESVRSPAGAGSRAAAAFRKSNQKPIPKFMQTYLREKIEYVTLACVRLRLSEHRSPSQRSENACIQKEVIATGPHYLRGDLNRIL
jgi:hypothetical protein